MALKSLLSRLVGRAPAAPAPQTDAEAASRTAEHMSAVVAAAVEQEQSPDTAALSETAKNDKVRTQLAELGDDGVVERHTMHFAYPESDTPAQREEIAGHLQGLGFETRPAESEGGVVFEHQTAVASENFDDLTEALSEWLREQGWSYDGWECAVVENR